MKNLLIALVVAVAVYLLLFAKGRRGLAPSGSGQPGMVPGVVNDLNEPVGVMYDNPNASSMPAIYVNNGSNQPDYQVTDPNPALQTNAVMYE